MPRIGVLTCINRDIYCEGEGEDKAARYPHKIPAIWLTEEDPYLLGVVLASCAPWPVSKHLVADQSSGQANGCVHS